MEGEGHNTNLDPSGTGDPPGETGRSVPVPAILLGLLCALIGGPIGMQIGLDAGEHPPLGSLCLGIFVGGFGGAAIGALFYSFTQFPPKTIWAFRVNKRYIKTIVIVLFFLVVVGLAWAFLTKPISKRHMLLQYGVGKRDFSEVKLSDISLVGVDLEGVVLDKAELHDAILSGANLSGASLVGVALGGSVLFEADLRGANLRTADLTGADLRGANLTGAELDEANLMGADLRGADLRWVDLAKANLHEARFDDGTRWPSGFQPEQFRAKQMRD